MQDTSLYLYIYLSLACKGIAICIAIPFHIAVSVALYFRIAVHFSRQYNLICEQLQLVVASIFCNSICPTPGLAFYLNQHNNHTRVLLHHGAGTAVEVRKSYRAMVVDEVMIQSLTQLKTLLSIMLSIMYDTFP